MSEPFVGEIKLFGLTFCPRGWAEADGGLLLISQNQALFSLYGTIYGGDGETTFGLPDLRGRVPIGVGAGPQLTSRNLGQSGGEESTTLTTANLAPHTHNLDGVTATATFTHGHTASLNTNTVSGSCSVSVTETPHTHTFDHTHTGSGTGDITTAGGITNVQGTTAEALMYDNQTAAECRVRNSCTHEEGSSNKSSKGNERRTRRASGGKGKNSQEEACCSLKEFDVLVDLDTTSDVGGMDTVTFDITTDPFATTPLTSAETVSPGATCALGSLTVDDATVTVQESAATGTVTLSGATDTAGGGSSHNSMQPYLVMRYCVATAGIYPSQ